MGISKRFLLLFLFLQLGIILSVSAQEFNTQFYTTHDGLTENEVKDIYQDREGFFWFATGNGISRFDGYRFKSYRKNDGLTNPIISQIVEDSLGNIWALGRQSLYVLYADGNRFLLIEGPDVKRFSTIAVFPGNRIIVAADEDGFFTVRNSKLEPYSFGLSTSSKTNDRNVYNQGDSLFFINLNELIYKYEVNAPPTLIASFPTGSLNRVFYHNDILYMATTEGAFKIDILNRNFEPLLPSTTPYNCLDILVDSFDQLWMTTNRGLLYRAANTTDIRVFKTNTNPYISGTWYWRVFEDRVKNIWFSPAGFGVGKLSYRFFVNYTSTSGLTSAVYWLMKQTPAGGLMLAGPNGMTIYNEIEKFPDGGEFHLIGFDIRSLTHGEGNLLYLVINNMGFYSYDLVKTELKKIIPNPLKPGILSNVVISTADRKVYLGTEDGLYVKEGRRYKKIIIPGYKDDILIWEIVEDDEGVLWIGTTKGLFAFKPGTENTWKHWNRENGLNYLNVKSIVPITSGDVWIAYFEAGGASRININKPDVVSSLNIENGLPTDKIFSMVFDQQQRLWLGTAHGLCRVYENDIELFDVNQGLLWIDFWRNATLIDNEKSIWFATSLGISKFVPEYELYPELALEAKITSAFYDETALNPIRDKVISYGDNYVQINYTALNFKSEKEIEFFYRLAPQNEDWKPAPQGIIEFRSLAPGTYTFEIKAKSVGRGWSKNIDSISFTVNPPFYLRKSFIAVIVLLIIAGAWIIAWYRTRSVVERNIVLNSEVVDRTKDLASKNTQLQKLINKLQKTQAQLVHSEKMASLGILASGLAHEVNNPISYALSNALYLKNELHLLLDTSTDLPDEVRTHYEDMIEAAGLIVDGSQRVADVVTNLQSFARPQEAEYKKADVNYNLESTLKLVQNRYRNRIEFELKLEKMLPEIYCYPSMLNQVFLNLLINAIHAIPEKGKIVIESKQLNFKTILITFDDTGTGISNEIKNRIYDPFFTTKPVGTGTGLGLAISHSIITGKHKGKLSFVDKIGKGTRFEIELPADLPVKPDPSRSD